jgi:hypothetical protein
MMAHTALYVRPGSAGTQAELVVEVNWMDELRKRTRRQ